MLIPKMCYVWLYETTSPVASIVAMSPSEGYDGTCPWSAPVQRWHLTETCRTSLFASSAIPCPCGHLLFAYTITFVLFAQAFVALCLGAKVLDDSPLAQHFLGPPQALWDDWDNIVAVLGRKVCPSGTRHVHNAKFEKLFAV